MSAAFGMSAAGPDLIAGYLDQMRAGLRVPTAEAELILAEAEDHLCETAAAGRAVGMTELEAQQAAISSFGPVRAVVRAHRGRIVTVGDAAMAVWKLAALLATTAGAGGLTTMFLLNSDPAWARGVRVVTTGTSLCQCSPGPVVPIGGQAVMALPYAAMAAAGLALLATRLLATRLLATRLLATRLLAARRLARRGTSGRDPLSPTVTASFFLLVTALLFALDAIGVGAVTQRSDWLTPISQGSTRVTVFLAPGLIIAMCLAVAVGYGLQAAIGRARTRPGPRALAVSRTGSG